MIEIVAALKEVWASIIIESYLCILEEVNNKYICDNISEYYKESYSIFKLNILRWFMIESLSKC